MVGKRAAALGRWLTLIGAVGQVGAIGGAALQRSDGAGALGTGSPAQAVFLASLGITLAGLLLVVGGALAGQTERGRAAPLRALVAAAIAAMLLLGGGSFAYALRNSHPPGVVADSSIHFKNTQLDALEGGFHQDHAETPITYAQLKAVTAMLDTMRQASARFKDIAVARAEGYQQITQDIPMLGAHLVNFDIARQGTFDPAQPPILLYEQAQGRWNLVGVSFLLPKQGATDPQPEVIPGNLAAWHDHTNLCVTRNLQVSVRSQKACLTRNGVWLKDTGWLLHVWVWKDSPQGVFSHVNSNVN